MKIAFSTTVGETGVIEMKIGLHQGSTLSPLLFIIIMDFITEDVEHETPWAMLFADDIALSGEKCDQVEGRLELWRSRLDNVGLKLSRKKTEHLLPTGKQNNIKLKVCNSSKYAKLPKFTGRWFLKLGFEFTIINKFFICFFSIRNRRIFSFNEMCNMYPSWIA